MNIKPVVPFIALLSLLLAGCTNIYTTNYRSFSGNQPAPFLDGYEPCDSEVEIISSDDFERDSQELYRNGYEPLGDVLFEGQVNRAYRPGIIEQANKIGACKVIITKKYSHTDSGASSYTVPHTTEVREKIYDKKGRRITEQTTYETVVVPYSNEIFDHRTVFFYKKSFIFGARFEAVPQEVSAKIGRNGGILIRTVVRGSPVYKADIFEGDVLLSLNGEKLDYPDIDTRLGDLLQASRGKAVSLVIWRNGETVKKSVVLAI